MTTAAPRGTIAVERLVKIAVISVIAFVVGFLGMLVLHGIAAGIGAAAGAHPNGRGNLESQLTGGGVLAVIAAVVSSWWTAGKYDNPIWPRVSIRAVFIGLLAMIATPIAIWQWNDASANAARRRRLTAEMATSGDWRRGQDAADGLAHTPGGIGTLREILFDEARPIDMRLLAGLEITQWLVDPPNDVIVEIESMIIPPGPVRQRFIEIMVSDVFITWPPAFQRWMLGVMNDADPKNQLDAVRVIYGNTWASPLPQVCTRLKELTRHPDATIRAGAMESVSACQGEQAALLKEGARDPDPVVRAAVVKRVGRRFGGTEDIVTDLADQISIAEMLIDDTDPAVRAAAVEQRNKLAAAKR